MLRLSLQPLFACALLFLFLLLLTSSFASSNANLKKQFSAGCPIARPVNCGNGVCCQAGQTCSADGSSCSGCPFGRPNPCFGGASGFNYCCPTGYFCAGDGRCERPDVTPSSTNTGGGGDGVFIGGVAGLEGPVLVLARYLQNQ